MSQAPRAECAAVYEPVAISAIVLAEAPAFGVVEKLFGTDGHFVLFVGLRSRAVRPRKKANGAETANNFQGSGSQFDLNKLTRAISKNVRRPFLKCLLVNNVW